MIAVTGRCEFCGEHGHDWSVHAEARADVRAWRREEDAANERQGDTSGWWEV